MKKILFLITLFCLGISCMHAQSFMDKMKQEKNAAKKPVQKNTATNSTYNPNPKQNVNKAENEFVEPLFHLKNRWKKSYIQLQQGNVKDAQLASANSTSAQWAVVPVTDSYGGYGYYRIKNKTNGTFIHCEYGTLQASTLGKPGWHSAQWEQIKVPGTNYIQLKNRYTKQYIHNEHGQLKIGPLGKPGWHSAHWELLPYSSSTSGTYSAISTKRSKASFSLNAVDMFFRYTDQVQGGASLGLKVGDRIKVLPNQSISDTFLNKKLDASQGKIYYGKTGISFDPKTPKICGHVFTVASTNPLTFREEFPENMRNGYNSYFKLKVIKL